MCIMRYRLIFVAVHVHNEVVTGVITILTPPWNFQITDQHQEQQQHFVPN